MSYEPIRKDLQFFDTCDVAVVGGGLAGGVAAWTLARKGVKVVLLEKEKQAHHKVCGEFISGEALPILEEMGIDLKALGATEITGFRLHGTKNSASAKLPFSARGLSRRALDEAVLEKAELAGAKVKRGVAVRDIVEGLDSPSGSIILMTDEGRHLRAQRLVVATGKTDIKVLGERAGRDSGYVGFKMHLKLKPSVAKKLDGYCELFVFDNGYGGLSPIENGLANFCFLIEKSVLKKIGSDWNSLTAHIAKSCWAASHALDGSVPQFQHPITVAKVPYGFVRRAPPPHGYFFVGDQMAVIPSLTGDGMTIALMTGKLAAESMLEPIGDRLRLGLEPNASRLYQRYARTKLRPQVDAGFYLHRLFKNPRWVDVATYAVKSVPALLDRVFLRTRCRLDDGRASLASQQKASSKVVQSGRSLGQI